MIRLKIQNFLFEFIASKQTELQILPWSLGVGSSPRDLPTRPIWNSLWSEHGTFPTESLHLYKLTNSFMTCQHPSYIWRIVWINKNWENHTLACLFLSKNYWRSDLAFGQRCISASIFSTLNPSKQGVFQPKKGWFNFQVHIGTHIQQDLRWLEGPRMTTLRALQTWAWHWLRCLRTKGLGRGALRCWPRNDFSCKQKPAKVSKKHPHPTGLVENVTPSFVFSHHLTPTTTFFFFPNFNFSPFSKEKTHITWNFSSPNHSTTFGNLPINLRPLDPWGDWWDRPCTSHQGTSRHGSCPCWGDSQRCELRSSVWMTSWAAFFGTNNAQNVSGGISQIIVHCLGW